LPSPLFLKLLSLTHSLTHPPMPLFSSQLVHSYEVLMLHFVYCKSKEKF
jgi:hypothetical protein